jgi:rSAM/selenodomain-associated transferase 2
MLSDGMHPPVLRGHVPDLPSPEPLVSVIVPTLEEAGTLPGLLDHLAGLAGRLEIVVADGGSLDATARLARDHPGGPRVVEATGGRARQLNAGAAVSSGEMLVFVHADSRLPPDAYRSLAAACRDRRVVGGNFRLRFEGGDRFERVLAAYYRLSRRLGVYYGDSSLFVRREVFELLGGFRELPIMDDYDFARRMERFGRTGRLPGPAVTSARRWHRLGLPRTIGSWIVIRWLYLAGVPAERLAGLYRAAR